jgi:Zn-dependent protease/predicted transcriptional regulator
VFGERSIQLLRVRGIRIGASPSWFLILFLAIYLLSGSFQDALGTTQEEAYVVAVLAAVLFFASIVLHELGHAFAARRSGIRVEGIDLWLFGGIAKLDRDSRSPGEEFKVAVAGPAVTLLIVAVCFGITAIVTGAQGAIDVARLVDGAAGSRAELLIGFVASMNAILFVFNLLPAFPLDGGRIARSIVWKLTGDRTRGTVIAARVGQGFGFVMMGFGAYEAFAGGDGYGGLWWLVLGWLIAGSAKSAAVSAKVTDRLEGVTVADIMDTQPVTMPASTRIIDAEAWLDRYGVDWMAVTDDAGRLLGIAERDRIVQAINQGRPALAASEILTPGDPVSADLSLEAVIGAESLRRLGAVMAVDADGVLCGVLTIEQVRRALTTAVP